MEGRAEALRTRFYTDATEFLSRSKEILADLISGISKEDDIHELFRCVHSVKSEAAFLRLEEIEGAAHGLESVLERARSGGADSQIYATARSHLDGLEQKIREADSHRALPSRDMQPRFNQFEMRLLTEAQQRGELLYSVHCELDPETPMKQARAFLLLSNLEQIAGVIRMEPSIHVQEDDAFGSITVYLTAAGDEADIFKALDIDQVVRTSVDVLAFPFAGAAATKPRIRGAWLPEPPAYYRLGTRKLGQMTAYADEIKITLRELDLDLSKTQDMDPKVRGRVARLSHLAGGLFDELRGTKTSNLAEEFDRLEQITADLSVQLQKPIECVVHGGEIEIDRRNLIALSDPLVHLVRNAADHGIENSNERESSGKKAAGSITIVGADEGSKIRITVTDDGRGIDESAIKQGLSEEERQGTLLSILSRPGFSTLESATGVSGRGVGLDLAVRRVESIGGEVLLKTKPGEGTTVTIILPKGPTYAQLLFFRLSGVLYAVANHTVSNVAAIGKGDLKRTPKGSIYYKNTRAFLGENPATVSGAQSYGAFAIQVSHLGKNAAFLADDVLFEHDVEKELLEHEGAARRKRLAVRFGSGKREFYYLPPLLLRQ